MAARANEVGTGALTQLADVAERLELEVRIKHGAESMLRVLDAQGAESGALRTQIQRELDVAEEQIAALQARRDALQPSVLPEPSGTFLKPRAIRAIQGLEDLNRPELRYASPSDEGAEARVGRLAVSLARVLTSIAGSTKRDPTGGRDGGARRTTRAQIDALLCLLSLLRTYASLRAPLDRDVPELLPALLELMGHGGNDRVRAHAVHLVRYLLHRDAVLRLAESYGAMLPLLLGRALVRERTDAHEREQALKCVRALVFWTERLQLGEKLVTEGLVRTLTAIAQEPEDPLYASVIETLAELAMLDAPLLARTLALEPLWRAICDMPPARSLALADGLLGLLERPETLRLVGANMDLAAVLAGFTHAPLATQDHYDQRLRTTEQVVLRLLSTWHGLLYLCLDEGIALRALIAALRLDQERTQLRILATLTSLLQPTEPRAPPRRHPHAQRRGAPPIPQTLPRDQYLALVLKLLLDAHLLDALVSIVRDAPALRAAASHVLYLVLHAAQRVFPASSSELHAFPQLVHPACDTHNAPLDQLAAKTALQAIDAVESRLRCSSLNACEHQQHYLDDVRQQKDAMVDDAHFRALLRDSMVMATKEHQAWNLAVLHELLDGPLRDARRFDEALTTTKLVRRLLSFFRPFSQRYAALRANAGNEVWTAIGRKYFRTVLLHADGVRFLAEDRFLTGLREALEQLVARSPDALLSARAMRTTLVGGYVDFLQVLSESTAGLDLLYHARIYTPLLALCSLDDHAAFFAETLVQALDYTHDAPTRLFLQRALTAGTAQVRLSATLCVSQYLWLDAEPQAWAIALLLAQLHDVAPQVRRLAAQLLRDACAHPAMLAAVMAQRPLLALLGEEEDELLLRFLSHSNGFAELHDEGFVARCAEHWLHYRNLAYVADAEQVLQRTLDVDALPVPVHLYAELVATEAGTTFLARTGHLERLLAALDTTTDADAVLHGKAALWALVRWFTHLQGHAGTSVHGLALLEQLDAIAAVTALADTASVVSVRATCFYALNLLTATQQGAATLQRYGWYALHDDAGLSLCLPTEGSDLLHIPRSPSSPATPVPRMVPPANVDEAHIWSLMTSLGNAVVASTAWHALAKVHAEYPERFRNPSLLCRAVHLMDHFALRITMRRHLWSVLEAHALSFDALREMERLRADLLLPVAPRPTTPPRGAAPRRRGTLLYPVPVHTQMHALAPPKAQAPHPHTIVQTPSVGAGSAARPAWPLRMTGFAPPYV